MKFRLLERTSFRASTKTMWLDLMKAHPRLRLADDEVVVFLSQREDNLRLVYGYMALDDGGVVLRSRELRLMEGEWSVTRLKEYAAKAGMKIDDWSAFDRALKKVGEDIAAVAKKLDKKTKRRK